MSPAQGSTAERSGPWIELAFSLSVLVLLACLLADDLWVFGLNSQNGRFVSFCHSIDSCLSYRDRTPLSPLARAGRKNLRGRRARSGSVFELASSENTLSRRLFLLLNCTLIKFGSGVVISLLLDATPVLLKGWRHYATFLLALLFVQLSPSDLLFRTLRERTAPHRATLSFICAVYKFRKLMFIVSRVRDELASAAPWANAAR